MVHPRLRDIQYLHIKISKEHKDLIVAWRNAEDCFNTSDFVRSKLLKAAKKYFAEKESEETIKKHKKRSVKNGSRRN